MLGPSRESSYAGSVLFAHKRACALESGLKVSDSKMLCA